MTSIKLTEEQKNKLIEICIALFPEYKNIYWDSVIIMNKSVSDSHIHFGKGEEHFRIHWYELIENQLYNRLFQPEEFSDKHKVDFFYEEFLKLSL